VLLIVFQGFLVERVTNCFDDEEKEKKFTSNRDNVKLFSLEML